MRLNKTTSIMAILVMAIAVGPPSGLFGKNYQDGHGVDAIYQSIRNAGPVYEWDEEIVYLENEGMTMVCTLTIPRTRHLCPIVITMNGFAGVRDEDIVGGTDEGILKRNARILAEQGFASLRVDFRGQGDSDGEYQMTTFSTQVSDALAALKYIRTNLKYRVNTRSIGMLGFSQGGLVASTAAASDKRVDSLVLWSPATFPPHEYEGLITKQGIQAGLALPDGGWDYFPLYLDSQYLGFDVPLGKAFFKDLFNVDPLAEIGKYQNPLMLIVGNNDIIVWPQPTKGQGYLKYHKGTEYLVALNADHAFDYWAGPEKLDDAIYWGIAWFIKTLK
jgi:pimeloyl-ACP methyl ester carboxylesterase